MGSFPDVIYGDYGDEKVTSTAKIGSLPLGQSMVLPDGRKYRHSRAGSAGALLVSEVVRQGPELDLTVDQDLLTASAAAAGADKISLIMATTTMVANYYEDGYLYTNLSAGVGSVYKIKSHRASTGAADTIEFTLYPNDTLKLAVVSASSLAGVRQNEYANLIQNPTGTAFVGIIGGIPPVAVDASSYFWVQRSGVAVGIQDAATVCVNGDRVACNSVTAGRIAEASTASKELLDSFSTCLATGAASTYILVELDLE